MDLVECNERSIRSIATINKTEYDQDLESLLHNLSGEYGRNCIFNFWNIFRELYPNATARYESSSNGNDELPFKMDPAADIFWTVVFCGMLVCAISGNLIVFWIVLGHRRMQNVTNYFLVNLSTADLMMSCLNTSFNFTFMKSREWIFGNVYCTVNNFIAYMSVAVSVFSLVAIAIDRYIAIVRPLKPRLSKLKAILILCVIWVSSGVLAIPALLYSKTWTFNYDGGHNVTVCFLLWPDGPPTVSKLDYIYNIIFFVVTYIVPIVCMVACYGRIGFVLWGKGIQDENAANDLAIQRKLIAKRNVVKMFMVVVLIFAICWLPYHVYFIYTYHNKEVVVKPYIQHVYLTFYWLAMANAMVNPAIYYGMNARFRGYFQALMSSAKVLLCHPGRLFLRRSESKSSLDIGVRPMDGGVVRMELHHFTNQAPARRTRRQPFNTAATANGVAAAGGNTNTGTLPLGRIHHGNSDVPPPAILTPEYLAQNNSGSSSARPKTFRFGLNARRSHQDLSEPVSNVHSEPPLNRRAVHFNGNGSAAGIAPANNASNGGANGAAAPADIKSAHSSGDLRNKNGTKKLPRLPQLGSAKNRNSGSSGSADGYQDDQKAGVLRISAPFLNNPLVQHLN